MKIYKISQSYYNLEIAMATTDAEILSKILSRGKDDYVSRYAAKNPNCPPQVLAEILSKGKDDWISEFAARNPNCPPQALIKWYIDIGRFKFDPKKHIRDIDVGPKPIEDEGIKELERLISK